jgi:hypothetical protein
MSVRQFTGETVWGHRGPNYLCFQQLRLSHSANVRNCYIYETVNT